MAPVVTKPKMVRLTKGQIEGKLNFINNYINANNAADGSIFDPNSNVTNKNVATMLNKIKTTLRTIHALNEALVFETLFTKTNLNITSPKVTRFLIINGIKI